MAGHPDDAPGAGTPLDGHLDLDHLDLASDRGVADLDVMAEEGATLREQVAGWLEPTGLVPFVQRHRRGVVTTAVVGAVVIASLGAYAVSLPGPMPERPTVVVRASGPDPTAALRLDVGTGRAVGVAQDVTVTSDEPDGVTVALVRLAGPGLASSSDTGVRLDAGHETDHVTIYGALACDDDASTTEAVHSRSADYSVVVRRTSPEGASRDDVVPLLDSAALTGLVHRACLQKAVDRDLELGAVRVEPVLDVVAVDLSLELTNVSRRSWSEVHVAASAQPVVTNDGRPVTLEPGQRGRLDVRLWPQDCADPASALRDGLLLTADLGPSGLPPGAVDTRASALLALPTDVLDAVAAAAGERCGDVLPRAEVVRARLRAGDQDGSGGVIDLDIDVTTPGAGLVEVDHVGDGSVAQGEVLAYESPVRSVDGVARVTVQWRLPACVVLAEQGLPTLHVVLAGGIRRPYVLPLRGDALAPLLTRLCGPDVAARA